MISNKKLFETYLIIRMIIFISIIIIGGMVISKILFKIDFYQDLLPNNKSLVESPLMILNLLLLCFIIIDEKVKPAFVEYQLVEDEIIIKTYNPHSNRWESPFILFGYTKKIKELKVSREDYKDYSLIIGKLGFRKELKLQRIDNNGIYESSNINISLLNTLKYTNLILSVDRLRTKFCLN